MATAELRLAFRLPNGAVSIPIVGSSWWLRRFAAAVVLLIFKRSRFDPVSMPERMVAMFDEIYDRAYQAGRNDLNASIGVGLGRLASAMFAPFAVLNRIEYQAPWKSLARAPRCN